MADQEQKQEQPKQRTAGERITDLENAMMGIYQAADQISRDIMTIKEAIKLLGNKLDAVAKATQTSDDVISKLMVENNVAELVSKVDDLVKKGILQKSTELSAASFVVGQELDEQGNVANPRIQFTLGSLDKELQDKIIAGGIGQPILLKEGKMKFLVTEVYSIVAPPAPAPEAPAADPAPAADASAPAADQAAAPADAPAQPEAAPQSSSDAAPAAPQSSGSN